MRKAVLILALLPSAALAQNTSSNCYMMGPTWHCDANTTPAPSNSGINIDWGNLGTKYDPNAFARGYQQMEQIRRDRDARLRQRDAEAAETSAIAEAQARVEQDRQRDERSRTVRASVSEKLQAGHCDEAVAIALQNGEIELATQAKSFCVAPGLKKPGG
jgi:hypothetical protein